MKKIHNYISAICLLALPLLYCSCDTQECEYEKTNKAIHTDKAAPGSSVQAENDC